MGLQFTCSFILNYQLFFQLFVALLFYMNDLFCDNACLVMSLLFIQISSEERTLAHRQCNDGRCNFDFVEYFCGKGELTRHLLKKGFWGAAVDLINDAEAQDCLEPCGLRLFLNLLGAAKDHALIWLGTQCSSFVVLCLAQSQRYMENFFRGDMRREFVRIGNALQEFSSLVMFLSFVLNCETILEQPLNSCMPQAGSFPHVLSFVSARKHVTYAGAFGASSVKPLQLWHAGVGNFTDLERPKPDWLTESLATHDDQGRFTGRRDALEISGQYTPAFAMAVADIYSAQFHP